MGTANYDVICLSCSTQVGEIFNGRFVQHPGCRAVTAQMNAVRRCCHCGGSLYLEPSDPSVGKREPGQSEQSAGTRVAGNVQRAGPALR